MNAKLPIALCLFAAACGSDIKKEQPAPVIIDTSLPSQQVSDGSAIRVELSWDTDATDLDLHFAHESARQDANQPDLDYDGLPDPWLHGVYDCNWRNQTPDWGAAGLANDPLSGADDVDGYGPEIVTLPQPQEGATYHLGVRFFNDFEEVGATTATVRIYVGDVLIDEMSQTLSHGDLWEVATVTGDGVLEEVSLLSPHYAQ